MEGKGLVVLLRSLAKTLTADLRHPPLPAHHACLSCAETTYQDQVLSRAALGWFSLSWASWPDLSHLVPHPVYRP